MERRDAAIHSSALCWIPRAVEVPRTLRDNLNIWGNPSLWKTLRIDGNNCSWIFRSLMRGSLLIRHDGFYMPMGANDVCSCTVVLHCPQEDKYAEVTRVERSTNTQRTITALRFLADVVRS